MSRVGDQEVPKWVAYNYRDELVRAMKQIEDLQAVVDAAIVYVHATEQAHHGPYSQAQAKAHRNLIDEVVAYEENQE